MSSVKSMEFIVPVKKQLANCYGHNHHGRFLQGGERQYGKKMNDRKIYTGVQGEDREKREPAAERANDFGAIEFLLESAETRHLC